jgi:hypothetical protein
MHKYHPKEMAILADKLHYAQLYMRIELMGIRSSRERILDIAEQMRELQKKKNAKHTWF